MGLPDVGDKFVVTAVLALRDPHPPLPGEAGPTQADTTLAKLKLLRT